MFEFVRTHTKLLQLLLLILIVPSFLVFGIQGYSSFTEDRKQTVAKVDGQPIAQAEWDAAHQQQAERLRRQMPNLDPKLLDSAAMRSETLEQLVRERVMLAAAHRLHLDVSDDKVVRELQALPELAQFKRPDGSFDVATYKSILQAQGMTPQMFEARLAQDLKARQVMRGIADSVLAPPAIVASALDPLLQRREIRYARFDVKDYLPKVNPGDADIEAYYKGHEAQFRAPERATIEYVVLDLEVLKKGITVSDEELRKYYGENIARYTSAEERRARHILIKADKDAAGDVKQKAKARAEALLAELRKAPDSFADVARKQSEDPGSAAQGGDLDFFGKGAMTKPFEDAVYAMKAGEISNVVESDFGFHIIKLEATRGGAKKPFEEVRAAIEDEARKQAAQKKWVDAAEQFTNTVYSDYDSLKPVIDKLKLEKRSATVTRTPAPDATGALASTKLLEAVFATDAVRNKRNTDAVEVGPNQLASARIVEHRPAHTQPLAEVKDRVRALLQAEQAMALARKDGEARLAQLRKDGEAELPSTGTVSRARPDGLARPALDAVLRADVSKLPAYVGTEVPGEGFVVARIEKVLEREKLPEEGTRLQAQYAQVWSQAESQAYYRALKTRLKVEVKPAAALEAAASAASR
ncbi:SurA N-terminal domain-containing protein [Aquincola sp. S2]|uniref:Periplasmic chaperone PpiD n=1 Tax=Pseudaquabacterium terrae TaxID=2732868 RepID=A0ABX2EMT4_9BURK|nr:SurA N-terminal domain-containing protein [Aquabacterium terrae]NRF69966.1 SurA N-terminal domain-containing protein [Aquabacterium terrae]